MKDANDMNIAMKIIFGLSIVLFLVSVLGMFRFNFGI